MLELLPAELTIVACHGDAAVLEGWRAALGSVHLPIAPDEVWLIGARSDRADILLDAATRLPHALVLDQTDGWTAWILAGAGATEVLGRLMLAPIEPATPAPGLVQGAIAGVPGKVFLEDCGCCLLVPAPVGEFVRDRLLAAGADLDVTLAQGTARPPLEIGS